MLKFGKKFKKENIPGLKVWIQSTDNVLKTSNYC